MLPLVLYHGTSALSWRNEMPSGVLYVANSQEEAASYAYEAAACDEEEGFEPQPVVVVFSGNVIARLFDEGLIRFEPDWGGYGVTPKNTWLDTLDSFGSFCLAGDTEAVKREAVTRMVDLT